MMDKYSLLAKCFKLYSTQTCRERTLLCKDTCLLRTLSGIVLLQSLSVLGTSIERTPVQDRFDCIKYLYNTKRLLKLTRLTQNTNGQQQWGL